MPVVVSYALNGVELDSSGFHVTVQTVLRSPISVRRTVVTVAGAHGSVRTGLPPRFDEREVTIHAVAHGVASERWSERFLRLCSMPNLVMTRTERDAYTGSLLRTVSARVELSSLESGDEDRSDHPLERWTAVFVIPGVWWREAPRNVQIPVGGGVLLRSGAADAPITDLILRFRSVSSVWVRDFASGTTISWNGRLPSGKPYLYLDCGSLRAWCASGGDAWSGSADVLGDLDWDNEPLEAWPMSSGDYRIEVNQVSSSGAAQPVLARLSPAWW